MNILLTNDDGIRARGIQALYHALREQGHEVTVVAPMHQQSAVGQSLTVFEPVRARPYRDGDYTGLAVYGTPTDCVKLALGTLLKKRPDLVMSGINLGANIGPDILYSGTVAAATEAAIENIPSMAVSLDNHEAEDLTEQARHAAALAGKVDWSVFHDRRVLNVNYPDLPIAQTKGVRLCVQSLALWRNNYEERKDPRGISYWWLDGDIAPDMIRPDTDCDLLGQGYITVSPLLIDWTDREGLLQLENMHLTEETH